MNFFFDDDTGILHGIYLLKHEKSLVNHLFKSMFSIQR